MIHANGKHDKLILTSALEQIKLQGVIANDYLAVPYPTLFKVKLLDKFFSVENIGPSPFVSEMLWRSRNDLEIEASRKQN